MKKSYFFLSCAMAVTVSMSLQAKDDALLPPGMQLYSYAFENGAEKAKAAPASLSREGAGQGVTLFGSTFFDYTNRTWFVRTNTARLADIDRIARVNASDDYAIDRVMAGEMVNGKYYAHIIRIFSFVQRYGGWATVDTETGEMAYLWNAKNHNNNYDVAYNWDDQSSNRGDWDIYMIRDMAYNPADGKLYGVAQPKEATSFETVVGTINLSDGMLTPVANLDTYTFGITFGNDGTMYAAIRIGTQYADSYAETESCDIVKVDYKNNNNGYFDYETVMTLNDNEGVFRSMGIGTLTTDRATGTMYLYLNGLTADNQNRTQSSVFSIDPRNKTNTYLGRFGYGDMLVGATVPGGNVATDLKAPAVVTDLATAFDSEGAPNITLTWGLPESNWDLTDLTDLTAMKVAVDSKDNVVATLPAELATASYSYTAENLSTGNHTFYVWGVNNAGEGVASEITAWAGHDVPGAPVLGENHISADENNAVTISWSAPVEGKNGGWFDKAIKYNITRLPDNKVVAEGLDAMTFTDNTITETRAYSYVITPVTADGEGVPAETKAVIIGSGVTVPFESDLKVADEAKRFKTFDGASGYEFTAVHDRGLFVDIQRYPVDYYFVSPALMTTKGKVYRVEFDVYFHNKLDELHPNTRHDYEIVVGNGTTKEALNNVIFRVDDATTKYYYTTVTVEGWFTAENDTPYNVAFHLCTDNADSDMIAVSGCRVYEMHDIDLQAVEVIGSKALAVDEPSPYQVKVYNAGNNDVTNAEVAVVSTYKGFDRVLGRTVLPSIASHETKLVDVIVVPEEEGVMDLAGRVSVEGDGNHDNNMSPVLTVEIGSLAFDMKVDGHGENLGVEPEVPFGFYKTYYASQSIYHVGEGSDIVFEPVDDGEGGVRAPELRGIAYEYSPQEGMETGSIKDFDVEVYVSQTTMKSYRSTKRAVVLSDQTKVFEGKLSMEDGENNLLRIPFDTPYQLEFDKNLVVTVVKQGGASKTDFPYAFNVFANDWYSSVYRTVNYKVNNAPYPVDSAPEAGSGVNYCGVCSCVPVAYIAVEKTLGVDPVYVSTKDGKVDLGNLDNAVVNIFDLTGKAVYSGNVSGSVYDLPLANGLYIVSVADAEGVRNVKISIRR